MLISRDYSQGGWASELFEVIASLGAVAIAACGLSGIYPAILAPVATVVLGVAFAGNGNRLLRSYEHIRDRGGRNGVLRFSVVVAGLVGAALGVFALVDVDPAFLTPIASAVFGAGLVLKSNAVWELRLLEVSGATKVAWLRRDFTSIDADPAVFALSGFVSGALGAIAAAGNRNDLTLNLVAIVIAASTLAVMSRLAMVAMTRCASPIALVISRTSGRVDEA